MNNRKKIPAKIGKSKHVHDDFAGEIRQESARSANETTDRTTTKMPMEQQLWLAIRNRTQAIGFNRYRKFLNSLPFGDNFDKYHLHERNTLNDISAYNLLKLATEAFLIFESGLVIRPGNNVLDPKLFDFDPRDRRLGQIGESVRKIKTELRKILGISCNIDILTYLDFIVDQIVDQNESQKNKLATYYEIVLRNRLTCPSMIELIWSYWHEEGMQVQTVNAIALRFQNKKLDSRNPLANLDLDPLRPLSSLLWGFIQDEFNRLSTRRRAYEYDHQYGFSLARKAAPGSQSAKGPSKFSSAFRKLLNRTALFYREDDINTAGVDAFPLFNALREVHAIFAEGAHNQYGDLPWAARREMLMMQWLLARPETNAFLRGRYTVPYQEPWMGAVDDIRRLQGLSDVTVTHFHELAKYGEQILLSIRFGDWIDVKDQKVARSWARFWRPEIQRYIHAYKAVTGVDLAEDIFGETGLNV